MIKQKVYLAFIFTITLTNLLAQKSVNQFDKDGQRHGIWTKNYHKTDQKRYEGQFVHGKEVDTFKYYTLANGKSVLSATKVFNLKDSLADVTFYTSKKKVISKGKMNGKRYIGEWQYYHKNSDVLMISENYNENGELHGKRTVYYEKGNTAEVSRYDNGKLTGEAKWFSKADKLLRHSIYDKDKLNGKTINYDLEGRVSSEGDYKNNLKVGIWKYYKAGKIKKEVDHTNKVVIKKYE